MKYYSETTKSFYNTEKECVEAEKNHKKAIEKAELEKRKAAELRKGRAAEVEKAREEYLKARKNYNDVLTKFCKDYGAYHCSIKDVTPEGLSEYLDSLFGLF